MGRLFSLAVRLRFVPGLLGVRSGFVPGSSGVRLGSLSVGWPFVFLELVGSLLFFLFLRPPTGELAADGFQEL
jgi:hypothetical protein